MRSWKHEGTQLDGKGRIFATLLVLAGLSSSCTTNRTNPTDAGPAEVDAALHDATSPDARLADAGTAGNLILMYQFPSPTTGVLLSCEEAGVQWVDIHFSNGLHLEDLLCDDKPVLVGDLPFGELSLEVVSWDQNLWSFIGSISHTSAGGTFEVSLDQHPR